MTRWILAWAVFAAALASLFLVAGEVDALSHLEGKSRIAAAATSAALLAVDLFLPVPASLVMTFNGTLFSVLPGAAVSLTGLLGGALLGYALTRRFGRRLVRWIAGEEGVAAVAPFFARHAILAIVITRPVPLVAETITCMAGAADMPLGRFVLAQVLGCLPLALAYAWIGRSAGATGTLPTAILVAVMVPAVMLVGWRGRRLGKKGA